MATENKSSTIRSDICKKMLFLFEEQKVIY